MKQPLSLAAGTAGLLVIDLQEEQRRDERYLVEGFDSMLDNVWRLQQTARTAAAPVIHSLYVLDFATAPPRRFHPMQEDGQSTFSDSRHPWTAVCPEVAPAPGEMTIIKDDASVFSNPTAEHQIRALGVEWLMITGVWTEACVALTVRDAMACGFRVMLVKDACASGTVAMHQTAVLNLANRLYGGAVTDTDGACRLLAGETVQVWVTQRPVPLRFGYENAADLYAGL